MSQKEIDQIDIFDKLKGQKIKQKEAAKILGLSTRQIKRKLKEYRRTGAMSLIHKGRGKAGNHCLNQILKNQAINLVQEKYLDFGPTLAAEKLLENHNLKINHETLRLLMVSEDIWKPKQPKKPEIHLWRERRASVGEMIQLDGSPHAWFEDRAPKCTLLAFIDDASSQVLWGEFAESESTKSLMISTNGYVSSHGKPVSFYTDRGGVYKVNLNNPDDEKLTQYGRALKELGIAHLKARSPQAKGRVERLFGTLQDRLVKELRLEGISTIEEANRFIKEGYWEEHNKRFAVKPREGTDLHTSMTHLKLGEIFCLKEERVVRNDFTVSYKNRWFQLESKQPTIIRPKNQIEIWEEFDGTISFHLRELNLNFHELVQKSKKIVVLKERKERMSYKPPANHPWRQPWDATKSDISILL